MRFYEFNNFRIDANERILYRDGSPVALAPKVFDTLFALVSRAGRLVLKDDLMEEIWQNTFVEENNLTQYIFVLRRVLGENKTEAKFIETVSRRGYRFLACVRQTEDTESNAPLRTSSFPANENSANKSFMLSGGNRYQKSSSGGKVVALNRWRREEKVNAPNYLEDKNNLAPLDSRGQITLFYKTETEPHAVSVAVLPFKLIDDASVDDYLGIGFADALIVSLSKIGNLSVRPTASVIHFAAPDADAIQAGRELKVDVVLDGAIQKNGKNLRVSIQLIRIADAALLWKEARAVLAQLQELAPHRYFSPCFPAMVYAELNEPDAAVELLLQACENHDPWTAWIHTDPRYNNLRSSSHFQKLEKTVAAN